MSSLMSLQDVASLAQVRRPVVTVWRKRAEASAHPFPSPRSRPGGQELFELGDIVEWLELTERGNNPTVRADAAAHALWDGQPAERRRATAEVLSALLTLRHVSGQALGGLTPDEVLDLADEVDPDDACLFHEIDTARDLVSSVVLAESLVEATWGVQAAHAKVLDERFRTHWAALAEASLSPDAHRLLATITQVLRRDLDPDARLMDPTGAAVDALVRCADEGGRVLIMRGDGPMCRLVRRQLLLAGVAAEVVEPDAGQWSADGPVVQLVVLPVPGAVDQSPVDQLALIEEVALQMDERQVAVVLGPARVLTDALADATASARRDDLLRQGGVRAIVRLPVGLRPARTREHLALWLVTPPDASPAAERRTGVADLSTTPLSAHAVEGLTDDLLAARAGPEGARRRAWAHLAHVHTSDLVARHGGLVVVRRRRPVTRQRTGEDWIVGLRRDDEPLGVLAEFELTPDGAAPHEVSVQHAVEQGWVRIVQGHRVGVDDLPDGNLPVVSASDVQAGRPRGGRAVDRFALLARIDARTSEPGDIVFTTGAAPAAVLDAEGGALVLAPARVLRVRRGAPLVAASIVARINAAAPGGRWKTWPVAVLPAHEADGLGDALAGIETERGRLRARLAALDALASDLTTAVESRRITLHRKETDGATREG